MSARAASYGPVGTSQRHVIGEFVAAFSVAGREGALGTPERLAQQVKAELLPALSDVLEGDALAGCAAQIEVLDLDLGDWPNDPSWHDVRAAFREQLAAALAPYLTRVVPQDGPAMIGHGRTAQKAGPCPGGPVKPSVPPQIATSTGGASTGAALSEAASQDVRLARIAVLRHLWAGDAAETIEVFQRARRKAPDLFDAALRALPHQAHRQQLLALASDRTAPPRLPSDLFGLNSALKAVFAAAGHAGPAASAHAATLTARILLHPVSGALNSAARPPFGEEAVVAGETVKGSDRGHVDNAVDAEGRDRPVADAPAPDPDTAVQARSGEQAMTTTPVAPAHTDGRRFRRMWQGFRTQALAMLETLSLDALQSLSKSLATGQSEGFGQAVEALVTDTVDPRAALLYVLHAQLDELPVDMALARRAGRDPVIPEASALPQGPATGGMRETSMRPRADASSLPRGSRTGPNTPPHPMLEHSGWADVLGAFGQGGRQVEGAYPPDVALHSEPADQNVAGDPMTVGVGSTRTPKEKPPESETAGSSVVDAQAGPDAGAALAGGQVGGLAGDQEKPGTVSRTADGAETEAHLRPALRTGNHREITDTKQSETSHSTRDVPFTTKRTGHDSPGGAALNPGGRAGPQSRKKGVSTPLEVPYFAGQRDADRTVGQAPPRDPELTKPISPDGGFADRDQVAAGAVSSKDPVPDDPARSSFSDGGATKHRWPGGKAVKPDRDRPLMRASPPGDHRNGTALGSGGLAAGHDRMPDSSPHATTTPAREVETRQIGFQSVQTQATGHPARGFAGRDTQAQVGGPQSTQPPVANADQTGPPRSTHRGPAAAMAPLPQNAEVVDALAEAAFGAMALDFRAALETIWSATPVSSKDAFVEKTVRREHAGKDESVSSDPPGLTAQDRILLASVARHGAVEVDLAVFVRDLLQMIAPERKDHRQLLRHLIARMGYATGNTSPALRYRLSAILQQMFEAVRETRERREPTRQKNPPTFAISTPAYGLLTRHAGLVLFHPYYRMLFSRLGMLTPQNTLLPDQLGRAAATLSALAGEQDADRHIDPLARVLLGLPQDLPAPVRAELTAEDVDLIEGLIRAVIAQWARLGQTSPAGLQEAFVRRGGDLRFDDTGTQLRVEPGPFDVLLAGLPWALGPTIALPWMPAPCHVHWRDVDG